MLILVLVIDNTAGSVGTSTLVLIAIALIVQICTTISASSGVV